MKYMTKSHKCKFILSQIHAPMIRSYYISLLLVLAPAFMENSASLTQQSWNFYELQGTYILGSSELQKRTVYTTAIRYNRKKI